nr:hypothetical protein [Myrmica rubra rhabdo-like virus 1]
MALNSSRDVTPVTSYDVASPAGIRQELTDENLDSALVHLDHAQNGIPIPPTKNVRKDLDKRVLGASLSAVDPDPYDMPVDTSESHEDVIFADTVEITESNPDGDDDIIEDEPAFVSEVGHPHTTGDPMIWVMETLKIIHKDISQMKPLIDTIPTIKTRIDEVQGVMGEITTGFIEMKNSISNMEATITQNRITISKLTDLIKTMMTSKQQQQVIVPPIPPAIVKAPGVSDENIDKLISAISKQKGMGPGHETILRNMLILHDKEIILSTLKDFGAVRQILGAELDKLIQVDAGSSASMQGVLKILLSLLPTMGPTEGQCSGPCQPKLITQTQHDRSGKKVINPFKVKK